MSVENGHYCCFFSACPWKKHHPNIFLGSQNFLNFAPRFPSLSLSLSTTSPGWCFLSKRAPYTRDSQAQLHKQFSLLLWLPLAIVI